ncbi:hypothetical protein Plec18167_008317 [Paecilomyces lecythidis]|uniref:Mid2 domain-containing protein n=1 Tax=Paecilomyces lecythidis TaxID=3004212 RepID=A0ABR3WY67_9EURO
MESSIQLLWFLFILPVYSAYYFTNPPPESESANPQYTIGDVLDIQWAATDGESDHIDLSMWQSNPNIEYPIFYNYSGLWSYNWTIETSANLTQSNQFYIALYITGNLDDVALSHVFNLTKESTSASTSSPTPTSVTPAGAHSTSHTEPTSAPPPSKQTSQSSDQLSTGAKAGIGVAIPIAVIAGVAAGLLLARRKREKSVTEQKHDLSMQDALAYQNQPLYYYSPPGELSDTSRTEPVEMPVGPK